MNKVSRDNVKKSTFVISTIAILLMVTISSTPIMNSSAFDLGLISKDNNIGSIDTSSLFNCVGAAITCDNDNTVNNDISVNNDDNDTNSGDQSATLLVSKTVTCRSVNGEPSDGAVCNFALQSQNFPDPEDYPITVTGNSPSPSSFAGSNTPVEVSIEAGEYTVSEELFNTIPLEDEFSDGDITTNTIFTGDCTDDNPPSQSAVGTIAAGETQECSIENEIVILNGEIPE